MLKEIRGNPVWLSLVKKYTCRRGVGGEKCLSWANLENLRNWTERGKGLAEQAGTHSLSTNDVRRPNDGDEDWGKHAGTKMVIKLSRVERGLVNHA